MDVEHSSEIDFAAIYDPINLFFIQFLHSVSDFSPAKYTVPASHCYNPFDPMAPPNEPTIPLVIRGGGCHPAKIQSKHQLVPLLMLQRTPIPSHNPQVSKPD